MSEIILCVCDMFYSINKEKVWDPMKKPLMVLHQSQRDAEPATRLTCSQRGAKKIWPFPSPSIDEAHQKVRQVK